MILPQRLQEALKTVRPAPLSRLDGSAVEGRARRVLADWRRVLARNVADARPVLRELLSGEPIAFTPIDESGVRGYRFRGSATLGGLLTRSMVVPILASPVVLIHTDQAARAVVSVA